MRLFRLVDHNNKTIHTCRALNILQAEWIFLQECGDLSFYYIPYMGKKRIPFKGLI